MTTATIYMTAREAMDHSRQCHTIVRCEPTDTNRATLEAESDGSARCGYDMDYWADGDTDDGMIWQVMVEAE